MVVVFDLDDTLYDEIDFVQSGFWAVAEFLAPDQPEPLKDRMWNIFENEGSGQVFNKLLLETRIAAKIDKLVEIYRFHHPHITLSEKTRQLLESTHAMYPTALITDGHYLMQKNKFNVMGLERYIDYPVFTDQHSTRKPEEKPYRLVMERFLSETKFVYISDNPKKDFIAPRKLGWKTIRYKNPRGIYKALANNAHEEVTDLSHITMLINKFSAHNGFTFFPK